MKKTDAFEVRDEPSLSISDVSILLRVSDASVRNWIKAGHLDVGQSKRITKESLRAFRADIAGTSKLTQRANKSLFDNHDHATLSETILTSLDGASDVSGDYLSEEYETSLSNAFKNKEGIYYTPESIADRFFERIDVDFDQATFCDPCCGSGAFLLAAIEAGFKPENVYGFDIDEAAVAIARQRIYERTNYHSSNLQCTDFLALLTHDEAFDQTFDVIVTNPPWGKKLERAKKVLYGQKLGAGKSLDSSALFLFACLRALRPKGYVGFLLPESFFKISTFSDARSRLLESKILELYDFGKPFKGLLTGAKGFVAQAMPPHENRVDISLADGSIYQRDQVSFLSTPASIINLHCKPDEAALIERIFARPHLTLTGNARWGLGIVTGDNKRFCQPSPQTGYIPVSKGADIHSAHVDEASNYIPEDLSQYQQVAPSDLYAAEEKLIYRFISSRLIFFHDTQQRLFLNSANMVIIDPAFPIKPALVGKLFNARVMNWLYEKIFDTHKVLRADIERLPVFHEFLASRIDFTEVQLHHYLGVVEQDGTFIAV